MRDEDVDDTTAIAARHNELRDIHHRIDALKEENERQFISLTDKLHALEVAVARGGRFPPGAWVAALGLALSVVGTGAVLYGQLAVTQRVSQEAMDAITLHMTEMAPAETLVWKMDERLKSLESRIVGQGPDGWHRRDHDLYAQMQDERNDRIKTRLDAIEKKQELLCERVRECKQEGKR